MTTVDQRRVGKGYRRLLIFALIALMNLAPSARADGHQMPICTDGEFRAYFNLIVEYQTAFDGAITNANDLQLVSRAQLENRDSNLSQLPTCADAISIQRLLIQLVGDSLARAALQLADTPADENPYLQHIPDDQERIGSLVSVMLGLDRSDAAPPAQRSLPPCAPPDLSLIDDAARSFLEIYESTSAGSSAAESLDAVDRLLVWREDNLPRLPDCAETVDLILALSAAATDAAAYQAFKYAGVSAARNPFADLASAASDKLKHWQEGRKLRTMAQPVSAVRRELPRCSPAQLSAAEDSARAYADLIGRAEAAGGIVDLLEFAREEAAFRQSRLAQLPTCAEAFDARWWMAQALADVFLQVAVAPEEARAQRPSRIMSASQASARDALANLEQEITEGAPRGETAPACSEGEQVFLFSYLIPKFWAFTEAALKVSGTEEALALIEQSYRFRQLLWEYLPRCDDALELGLMMRTIAADGASMLALEMAGAPVLRIPYVRRISQDIELFFKRISGYYSTCGNINGGATTYFVVADNIANIRSCESTSCYIVTTAARGERLTVVDDMNSWYKILLPSCETAYIAGFLASRTPPPR